MLMNLNLILQNFQNWKQLSTIPNGLDGWSAARPSASDIKILDIIVGSTKDCSFTPNVGEQRLDQLLHVQV